MNLPISVETVTDYCKNNPYTAVAVVVLCTGSYFYLTGSNKSKSKSFPKSSLAKPGLVVVHGARPGSVIVNPSPYVLKLQTFLRMAKIDYVLDLNNPMGKKGKMPWIELDGKDYCDSTFIIEHLTKTFNVSMDDTLSDKQKATARVIQKTLEENTIWYLKFIFIEMFVRVFGFLVSCNKVLWGFLKVFGVGVGVIKICLLILSFFFRFNSTGFAVQHYMFAIFC